MEAGSMKAIWMKKDHSSFHAYFACVFPVLVLEVVVLVEEGVVVDEVEAVGEAPLVHHLEGLVEVGDLARRTN